MASEITAHGTGERGKWIWKGDHFVDVSKVMKKEIYAPFVWKDEVDPFWNHVRDCPETSMSTYKKHLKEDGHEITGDYRHEYKLPTREERFWEVREAQLKAKQQLEWGMAQCTNEERELWDQRRRDRERNEKLRNG